MFISQTQEKLYTCFKTTADSTNMPVIMYNNKPKTNVTIAPATVVRLARDCPNIVGVKNSTGMGTFPEVIKEALAPTDGLPPGHGDIPALRRRLRPL